MLQKYNSIGHIHHQHYDQNLIYLVNMLFINHIYHEIFMKCSIIIIIIINITYYYLNTDNNYYIIFFQIFGETLIIIII